MKLFGPKVTVNPNFVKDKFVIVILNGLKYLEIQDHSP
jgi:hypothetical protein